MYCPSAFRQDEVAELRRFAAAHPLAMLVSGGSQGLDAAHVPLLWCDDGSEYGVLRGHFARANPIWRQAGDDAEWLAVFRHSGHYVSAGWYPSKQQDARVVPTWNYQAVHVYGCLKTITEPGPLQALLAELTAAHEASHPRPWQISDAPTDYIEALCRAVVGFEIPVRRCLGKYKLSQNQSAANRAGVMAALRAEADEAAQHTAEAMRRFAPPAA